MSGCTDSFVVSGITVGITVSLLVVNHDDSHTNSALTINLSSAVPIGVHHTNVIIGFDVGYITDTFEASVTNASCTIYSNLLYSLVVLFCS